MTLGAIVTGLQRYLFPTLEAELGELGRLDREFLEVLSLLDIGDLKRRFEWVGNGRKPHERTHLLRAFIAKSVYQITSTAGLIETLKAQTTLRRLCGWERPGEVPGESVFSRVFGAFAREQWPQKIHAAMIQTHASGKLVGHISRDATAIEAPEKPARKIVAEAVAPPHKRGRPRKDEVREPKPPRRLELQPTRSLEENLQDLPSACNVGTKRNAKGYKQSWIGYKLHLDVIDGDIPVSSILTSASVHDSQVAIPLAQMSATRVTACYALMDSAYDVPEIKDFVRGQQQVPIIDIHGRNKDAAPFDPAMKQRYKQRSSAERVNSRLKERYGGNWVRVRGAIKVAAHLGFGLIALSAQGLLGRVCESSGIG